jgi:hypothetical protein
MYGSRRWQDFVSSTRNKVLLLLKYLNWFYTFLLMVSLQNLKTKQSGYIVVSSNRLSLFSGPPPSLKFRRSVHLSHICMCTAVLEPILFFFWSGPGFGFGCDIFKKLYQTPTPNLLLVVGTACHRQSS